MGSQQHETSAYQRARLPPATDLSLAPAARSPKSDATTTPAPGTTIGISGAGLRKPAPSSARGSGSVAQHQNHASKILPRGASVAAASNSRASSTRTSAPPPSKPKAAASSSSLLDNVPVVRTQLLMPFGAADMVAHGASMHEGGFAAFLPTARQRQQPLLMQQQQQPIMQHSPMQQELMLQQQQEPMQLQQPAMQLQRQWCRGGAAPRGEEENGDDEEEGGAGSEAYSSASPSSSSSSAPQRSLGRGGSQARPAAAATTPSPWLLDEGPAGGGGGSRSLRGSFGAMALADVMLGSTGLGAGRPPKPPLQLQPGSRSPQQQVAGEAGGSLHQHPRGRAGEESNQEGKVTGGLCGRVKTLKP